MTTTYGGELTLGQCIPMAVSAQAALDTSLSATESELQAKIAGLGLIIATPPPSLADLIAKAQALLDALLALLDAPLPDVLATLAALAELQAQLGLIQAALAFSANFAAQLGSPGVHYYVFGGKAPELGGEIGAHLSGGLPGADPNATVAGVIMLAADAGAISALQAVMRAAG